MQPKETLSSNEALEGIAKILREGEKSSYSYGNDCIDEIEELVEKAGFQTRKVPKELREAMGTLEKYIDDLLRSLSDDQAKALYRPAVIEWLETFGDSETIHLLRKGPDYFG